MLVLLWESEVLMLSGLPYSCTSNLADGHIAEEKGIFVSETGAVCSVEHRHIRTTSRELHLKISLLLPSKYRTFFVSKHVLSW